MPTVVFAICGLLSEAGIRVDFAGVAWGVAVSAAGGEAEADGWVKIPLGIARSRFT